MSVLSVIMDGHHLCMTIAMLEKEGGLPRTEELLHERHNMRSDSMSIQNSESIKLSKVRNTSTGIVRKQMSLVETTKAVANCASSSELEYIVTFVDVMMTDTGNSDNM